MCGCNRRGGEREKGKDRGGSWRAGRDGRAGGEARRPDGPLRTGREARFGGRESDGQLWGC